MGENTYISDAIDKVTDLYSNSDMQFEIKASNLMVKYAH